MKTKFFRKNASVKAGALVKRWRWLRLAMTALLLWPMVLVAQNGITLSGLVMDAGTVTFNVSWKNTGMPAIWSDTVWVWVDYNTAGTMTRLPLSAGATLTIHTAPDDVGKVIEVSGNDKGVWVVGNARSAGSFSATVRLLTATSTAAAACVYASNYPPVGKYTSVTDISITGTRPYDLVLKDTDGSNTVTLVAGGSYSIPAGYTLQSFTDKTGAPGVIKCAASAVYDLRASATEFCTGATVTFALSNTTSGRTYQLYKGSNVVNTLTGTGGAATFTGAFAGAGIYTAQVAAEGGTCATTMTGTHEVSEKSLPAAPTLSGGGSQCAGTAITFTASGGSLYEWSCSGFTCSGSGATQTTPTTAGNYSAQVRAVTTSGGITCYSGYSNNMTGTIVAPSGIGTVPNSCGCAAGLTSCGGACTAIQYSTDGNGDCSDKCYRRWKRLLNTCGDVLDTHYSDDQYDESCTAGCTIPICSGTSGLSSTVCMSASVAADNVCGSAQACMQKCAYLGYTCYSWKHVDNIIPWCCYVCQCR